MNNNPVDFSELSLYFDVNKQQSPYLSKQFFLLAESLPGSGFIAYERWRQNKGRFSGWSTALEQTTTGKTDRKQNNEQCLGCTCLSGRKPKKRIQRIFEQFYGSRTFACLECHLHVDIPVVGNKRLRVRRKSLTNVFVQIQVETDDCSTRFHKDVSIIEKEP